MSEHKVMCVYCVHRKGYRKYYTTARAAFREAAKEGGSVTEIFVYGDIDEKEAP